MAVCHSFIDSHYQIGTVSSFVTDLLWTTVWDLLFRSRDDLDDSDNLKPIEGQILYRVRPSL